MEQIGPKWKDDLIDDLIDDHVAAARFFLLSLNLHHSGCTLKNLSHPEVTFVTFTPSFIVN